MTITEIDVDDLEYELALADPADVVPLLCEMIEAYPQHRERLVGFVVELTIDRLRNPTED